MSPVTQATRSASPPRPWRSADTQALAWGRGFVVIMGRMRKLPITARRPLWTLTALISAGCPDRQTGSDEGASETSATGTGASGTDTTEAGATETVGTDSTPTTGVPDDTVIAPVIAEFRPLGAPAFELANDPFQRWKDISILSAGQAIPAVYDGSTRLEFAGIPEGPYVLHQQFPEYPTLPGVPGVVSAVVTDARELMVYTGVYAGRPDIPVTYDLGTRVALSVSGLQPLGEGDSFEIYSYQADALAFLYPSLDPEDGTKSPVPGATGLDGWTVPWRPETARAAWSLPDTANGDDLWLAQLSGRPLVAEPDAVQARDPWSYATVSTLTAAGKLSSTAFAAGKVTEVTGTLAPVAAETATFDLRVNDFLARVEAESDASVSARCYTSVFLEPGIETPIVGMTPSLASIDVFSRFVPPAPDCEEPNCAEEYAFPGNRVFDLALANPYPGGTELAQILCSMTTVVPHPKTGDDERLTAYLTVVDRVAALAKGPIVPLLDIVRDVRVNGMTMSPSSQNTGVGTTPTVSFTAPSFGNADGYSVAVVLLDDTTDIDGALRRSRTVGAIRTRDTTVTIPEGLLQPGSYYYLRVLATHGQTPTAVNPYTHELAYSSAITGIMTP